MTQTQENDNLKIFASPLPFSTKQLKAYARPGTTVQEIVDQICPVHLVGAVGAIVLINDHKIPRKNWHVVRPKLGTIINVRIVPKGGGHGGKSPLSILLSIAVAIAAPYAGAYLAAVASETFSTLTLADTLILGKVFSVGLGLVGSLLVNALAPPPKQPTQNAVNNPAENPTQFIEGAQNSLNAYGIIPICLGTNRMVPPLGARTFTETQDNDQFVRQLFCWGYGKLLVSDFDIGDTDISQFTDVQMEHRLNGDLNTSTSLYSQDVQQDDYSVLITQAGGYVIRTTTLNADEAQVDFTFGQGLSMFNSQGARLSQTVQLQLEYAAHGDSPQVWSPAVSVYTEYSGASIVVADVPLNETANIKNIYQPHPDYVGYRRDLVVLDQFSGAITVVQGDGSATDPASATVPILPPNKYRLATVLVKTLEARNDFSPTTTIDSLTDDRDPTLFGKIFETSGDFLVTNTGTTLNIADGGLAGQTLTVTAAQTEALRVSQKVIFPTTGQYDIRVSRLSADTASDQIFDKVDLTAIRSVRYTAPVTQANVNGTAIRIKATDQLNGVIDQLSGLVSNIILDYNEATAVWSERATSNPASLYRYVLQCPANAKALPDSKIAIDDLEDWHTHCIDQGYSYNRVIDYAASVDDILRDIAAAGAASPAVVDGKRTICIDRLTDDIVQVVTPRNSWGYQGTMTYPDMPHGFRCQFRNADNGYLNDEIIAYDDGYNASNATLFEVLQLQSCTNASLAYKTGRRHLASGRLRPETHEFTMDIENLTALRGQRIKFAHDVPIIGIGDGRVREVFFTGDSPEMVSGISIDDTITVPSGATFYMRIRKSTGRQLFKEVITEIGDMTSFTFREPFSADDAPAKGDLCYFVEVGEEIDLIITKIEPADDLTAKITCVNYAPAVFTAESTDIPAFQSGVTIPLEFQRPLPPILVTAPQSDESVMLRNSDGTFTPRMIITLQNPNEGVVTPQVKIRLTGSSVFTNANVLQSSHDQLILTGLDDGKNYDIWIRYQRSGSSTLSVPLQLNNITFVGAAGLPADVLDFFITVAGDTAIFKWTPNVDIDLSHYRMKFSGTFSGATWATAQIIEDDILTNRISLPFQPGTYLIKAVDIKGNESPDATVVITFDPGVLADVVATLTESPSFAGTKDNVVLDGAALVLDDTSMVGYYYFDNDLDLGDVYTSQLSSSIVAGGANLSGGGTDLFTVPDIFAMSDVYDIDTADWSLELQMRTTLLDPSDSPDGWGEWVPFRAGSLQFRAIQFRVKLMSLAANITPHIEKLIVTIDMPDRIERLTAETVTSAGYSVVFSPEFLAVPASSIQLQNGAVDDKIEFVGSKTTGGFTFKVYNATAAGYVTRVFDCITSGYGRKGS